MTETALSGSRSNLLDLQQKLALLDQALFALPAGRPSAGACRPTVKGCSKATAVQEALGAPPVCSAHPWRSEVLRLKTHK